MRHAGLLAISSGARCNHRFNAGGKPRKIELGPIEGTTPIPRRAPDFCGADAAYGPAADPNTCVTEAMSGRSIHRRWYYDTHGALPKQFGAFRRRRKGHSGDGALVSPKVRPAINIPGDDAATPAGKQPEPTHRTPVTGTEDVVKVMPAGSTS